jgi:superfamily II DNA or RNA helicase
LSQGVDPAVNRTTILDYRHVIRGPDRHYPIFSLTESVASSMPPAALPQLGFPFDDAPARQDKPVLQAMQDEPVRWDLRLVDAIADKTMKSGYLPIAEEAVREYPGKPYILLLAAAAAILDQNPERAHVFLKRFSKRFEPNATHHLLSALAAEQQKQPGVARVILERHGLTTAAAAYDAFPYGWGRRKWIDARLTSILGIPVGKSARAPARPPAGVKQQPATKAKAPLRAGVSATPAVAKQAGGTPVGAAEATEPDEPAPLPRIDIDIPFTAEFDLAPLVAAAERRPGRDGAWYGLRERFAHLGLAQGFDELLCLPHLTGIETFWYQVETVRKVLKQFRGRVLLADEVGLGKTIEAGMVLKEYLLRGMAERVLVLTPASLVGQWHEELETKFDIACATTHDALLRSDADAFWRQKRIIASIAQARRAEHAKRLFAHDFDLVIVDEAHHLRDRTSASYKLVDGLNKRFLLLLSATPVQNDLTELYNLLTLLKPGIFKTLKEFKSAYVTAGKPRQPANPERLRELMRSAMVRNTRAVVALKLPRRHAATIRVDTSDAERAAYLGLAAAVRDLAAEGAARHRLSVRHLLAAAGSSPAAAAGAAARFAADHPGNAAWTALSQQWAALPRTRTATGKETALLDLLRRNPDEKKLVFVQYRDTLDHLAGLLDHHGIAFARFDGSLSGPAKDAAIARFRDEAPVLLCTESGGEGRNIQFCNTLINFDVPWNPMAIEQRIGRIDRIGQSREVFVFNLVTRGTLEEQVLRLLDEKISMFELVVGEVGAILGGLDEDRDFAELVLDAWLETTETTRDTAFDTLGRRLDDARRQHDGAKALDDALFGQDFETA